MDAQQFAYWLQGFAELNEAPPTAEQWQSIREHLATVFVKVTPPLKPSGDHTVPAIKPIDLREINRRLRDQQPAIWPSPTSAERWVMPTVVECKGGTILASGDGVTTLC